MKITIASGKGGTGKTTLATSLALSLAQAKTSAPLPLFLDCDVEAPNAHLFLKPTLDTRLDVPIMIPHINEEQCTHCGRCAEVCQFHAIAVVGNQTIVFPQLCHGCGSCVLVCRREAITEKPSPIGIVERGITSDGMVFARGVLNTGEPMAVPIIRQLKQWIPAEPEQIVIIDAPPGTSCPVVETMRGSDVVLLVTEPTPFGLHDLNLAVQVARELHIPMGVIINRDGSGYDGVDTFCAAEGVPILLRIPFDRALAEGIARGNMLVEICPAYQPLLQELYSNTRQLVTTKNHTEGETVSDVGVAR